MKTSDDLIREHQYRINSLEMRVRYLDLRLQVLTGSFVGLCFVGVLIIIVLV